MSETMTKITPDGLIAAGYKEHPPGLAAHERRLFQKRFDDATGARFFVNFREWGRSDGDTTYDTQVCCETDSGGYLWAVFKEQTIEASEARAEAMWIAAGSVYYT